MPEDFKQRCAALVENLGLCPSGTEIEIRPLTGGVASDIGVITLPDRQVCVKFALAKLKVSEDWRAPVHRNRAEYAWLSAASACVPHNVPQLFGWSAADNGFAMEYLNGENVYLWKDALLAKAADQGEAAAVADILGRIHATSAQAAFDRAPFQNRDDFRALRIEPYLGFTASRHPDLAEKLDQISTQLYCADKVLVHGDVSPKNILFRDEAPILLDAECATMGDASFDVAFCLNHLFLKAMHMPALNARLMQQAASFWAAYSVHVNWEECAALEARVAALLPALMLARVDGKSPVEYLSPTEQAKVRAFAHSLIAVPMGQIADVIGAYLSTSEAS